MGHTDRGFSTFLGKCLILLLKIYHAIAFIPLIFFSILFLPFGPAVWKSTPGLNIIYDNSLHTIVYMVSVVSICTTAIGIIGAISKKRAINLLVSKFDNYTRMKQIGLITKLTFQLHSF